jgi:hypothetical protein
MEKKPEITHAGQQLHEKKQYQSPQLATYGNIREITKAVGPMGNTDNGTQGGQKKSSLRGHYQLTPSAIVRRVSRI